MKNLKRNCFSLPTLVLCGALSCVPFLVSNPPSHPATTSRSPDTAQSRQTVRHAPQQSSAQAAGAAAKVLRPDSIDDVDFSVAFQNSAAPAGPRHPGRSLESGTIIRVLLAHDASKAEIDAPDTADLHAASPGEPFPLQGRIVVRTLDEGSIGVSSDLPGERRVMVPCTLSTRQPNGFLSVDRRRYRGSLILCGREKCAVVNSIDIEDYLPGVVPLEMGKVEPEELEALKAQAVAARTFAAKRMRESLREAYDLTATIADQVYGGADVETPEADSAVNATAGLVLKWRDSLADVYYHSTCGGRTAANDEAWDKPPCPYLRSESDLDADGHPYCAFSPLFEWEESWSAADLSKIIRRTVVQVLPEEHFAGDIRKIKVVNRYRNGRVKTFRLVGTKGSIECGGDKLRQLLRRKNAAGAILRSGNISVVKNGPRRFTVHGIGYGHGVGMCQMGAIGRARDGQTFTQILSAYFRGTEVGKLTETEFSRH